MRKQIKNETLNIECNYCWKTYTTPYIYFEMIDDLQMRIYEANKNWITSHYKYGRKELDFCSSDCAIKFLNNQAKFFVKEITAWIKIWPWSH